MLFDGAVAATTAEAADSTASSSEPVSDNSAQQDTQDTLTVAGGTADTRREVVFVDGNIQDYQQLLAGLPAGTEVMVLDASRNGLEQIADYLQDREGIDAIHLLSHGESGAFKAGNTWVDNATLNAQSETLARMGEALSDDGDILLYGCKTGEGASGAALVTELARLTQADVAASSDNTGASRLGGNWVLETGTGAIETTAIAASGFDALLAAPTSLNFDNVDVVNDGDPDNTRNFGQSPRVFDGWTVNLVDSGGNDAPGDPSPTPSYLDVTANTADSILVDDSTDKALKINGWFGVAAEARFTATTGEEFWLQSFHLENLGMGFGTLRVVGYRDGVLVASQDFTANLGVDTTVTINQGADQDWQNIDQFRIVQQNGDADLLFTIDDITVAAAVPPNTAPSIGSLAGDSVAWAGVGNTVVIDAGANAALSDTELGALNGGNGNWSGASLVVQRPGTAVGADAFGFDTSGALFTVSVNNLQSGGQTFATFSNTGGVLTISFTSSAATATTALVNDIAQRITYRSDTPAGDATLRFTLSDGSASTTADVTVTSDTIYVTNTSDVSTIDPSNGVGLREAVAIAAADATGSQTLIFSSSLASQTITLGSALSITESLTVNADTASGVIISSSNISLGGGTTLSFTHGSGDTATINSTISGTGGVAKSGAGTLTLGSTSNNGGWSGAMSVTGGTLTAGAGSNPASTLSSGTLTLDGGTLAMTVTGAGSTTTLANNVALGASGGTFNITGGGGANTANVTGVVSGGDLTKSGASILQLSGTNTYTGTTTVSGGTLRVGADANLGGGAVTVAGSTVLDVTGATTIDNSISLSGSATISNANSVTLSGAISGANDLSKSGSGTLTLSGTNSYSGTTLSAGTLSVASDSNLGSGSVTLGSGTTLAVTGNGITIDNAIALSGDASIDNSAAVSLSGAISGANDLSKSGAGALTLSGSNSYSGTSVSAGTLSVGSDANLGSGSVSLTDGTILVVTGATTIDNAIALTGVATVNAGAAATLSGVISGTGGLNKTGASSLTLSASNTYTGTTTVSAGSLLVSGSTDSATTVASGGTLAGGGTIGGAVTVQNGGTLSPGSSPGTLTVDGNLTMDSGSTLAIEINGTAAGTQYDQVIVNGTVDVSGATLSTTHGYTPGNGDSYTIIVNDAADAVTGSFSGLAEGATVTAGGNGTVLTASYIGVTGNDFTLTAPVNPTVSSVSSISSDSTYKIGDTVTLVVNFSEAVFLSTGTIQLMLETGTTDRAATYLAGSGSSSLYFSYTVQEGDISSDLDFTGTTALVANGDTIQSGSFIDANLTLASPGAAGSIAASKDIVIDGVRPTASIVVADTALAASETSTVTITFNEAVSGLAIGDFTVANGALSGLSSGDGGITWTATLTPTASITDTTNLITLDNTGVADAAGNTGTGTTDSNNYAIDTLRPTASIVVADTALAAGETSTVTITFNEAVSGLAIGDFTVANGALSGLSSGDGGITWTATLTPTASVEDTTNLIVLDNTGVADAAGNTGTGTTDSNNYAIDTLRPTASIVVADTALAAGETSTVTITFNEAVSGLAIGDFTVANGALSGLSSGDGGITWTATLTPTASVEDTTNLIVLDNTGLADAAGNTGTGTTDSNNYAIDTLRPTASIVVADTALSVGETSTVTITFNEAVSGLAIGDFTVANGALSGLSSGDGGITWTATLTPTASITDTTNLITLDNTGVADAAGNSGSGTTDSNNYAIDTLRPTASVVVADTALAAGETSTVTITFNEAVSGLAIGDLTVANGALSGLSSSDGGITWMATLTPTASVTDTTNLITLDNTGVADAAGNSGSGTTDSNNYAIDTLRPTASIVVADTALVAGETSSVTITFNEAVSGLTTADFTVANGALSSLSSSDGGITWTATLTPTASVEDATNLIVLDNTGLADAAGNTGTGSTNSNNYALDTLRPTASIVVADTALAIGETSTVTITFNEAVSGLTTADFTVANGVLSGLSSADGGITWTATLTPSASVEDTSNLITLDNTGLADLSGNAGSGTTGSNNYAIDTLRPTASIVVTDTALAIGETSTVTITFNEAVSGLTSTDFTVANGALSNLSSADGGITWTTTLTPTASVEDTTNIITLDNTGLADLAGNAGSGTTDSNDYSIDSLPPSVTSVAVPAIDTYVAGQNLDFTVNFSEAVSVDTSGGTPRLAVTLDSGGTVFADYLSGSGSSALTFRLTVASGQLDSNGIAVAGSIALNGGTLRDSLGNAALTALNGIGDTSGVRVDAQVPAVVSLAVPGSGAYNSGDVLSFTVNASEAVLVDSNGGSPRLAIDLGGNTVYADYVSGSGSSALLFQYSVQAGDNDSDGIALAGALDLNGATLSDAAGNAMSLVLNGAGATSGVIVDTTPPSADSLVRVDLSPTSATSVRFTLTFSEAVSGVDASDFSLLSSGSAVGTLQSVLQLDARTYQIIVGNLAGNGSLGLGLNAAGSAISDAAGNNLLAGLAGESYLIAASGRDPEFLATPPVIGLPPLVTPPPAVPSLPPLPTTSPLLPSPLFEPPTLGSGIPTLGTIFINNGALAPSFIAQVFASSADSGGDGSGSGFLGFGGGDAGVFGASTLSTIFGSDSMPESAPLEIFDDKQWHGGGDAGQGQQEVFGAPTLGQQLHDMREAEQRQIRDLARALGQVAPAEPQV